MPVDDVNAALTRLVQAALVEALAMSFRAQLRNPSLGQQWIPPLRAG